MPKRRAYDSLRWRRLRKQKLNANPICEYKLACTLAPAVEVDHKIPIDQGGDAWEWSNLVSTCKACHLLKTRYRVISYTQRRAFAREGCGCEDRHANGSGALVERS
jgi:5-methylcytosine-specific restriction endonuclease McrA